MTDLSTALLDGLRTAIAVVQPNGNIAYRNHAFNEIFGAEGDDWVREGARVLGGERGWIQGFFADGHHARIIDVDFHGRTYRVEELPLPSSEAAALSFEDVTKQREAEQAKSDFTSMIVHDLRGPLSGIQGTFEFVMGGQGSTKLDPLHEDLLREAQRESERMMGLINELLDFSKIESGNFDVEHEAVNVPVLLRRAVRSLQPVATRDGVHLLSAHSADLPTIEGSVEKLTQAIINLISNSLKFTPKEGLVSVAANVVRDSEGPRSVVITVTDSGIGIKADDVGKIFEKYKQSRNKSFRGGAGTGLGLYIVKQIVEAHGGRVEVASVEGVGTSMILELPVRKAA